jgi:hypothetical protein
MGGGSTSETLNNRISLIVPLDEHQRNQPAQRFSGSSFGR